MPFNHTGNTANDNALGALASGPGHSLAGRVTGLPIYEVRYYAFSNHVLSGPNFDTVIRSINRDNARDLVNRYRQPTNHYDALGNLPVAPGGRVVYREYFLPGNAFANPGYVRIIADPGTRRPFCHADPLRCVPGGGGGVGEYRQSHRACDRRRPQSLFLISGAGAVNDIFL